LWDDEVLGALRRSNGGGASRSKGKTIGSNSKSSQPFLKQKPLVTKKNEESSKHLKIQQAKAKAANKRVAGLIINLVMPCGLFILHPLTSS